MDNEKTTWINIAEGLYEFLNRTQTTIQYTFKDMTVAVPQDTGENAPSAKWHIDGTIRVNTWEGNASE